MNDNNKKLTMEIQADVFQALIKHLQNKTEVQNIDLMNLADFCRNCLSKWYVTAAKERGMEISYEEARDLFTACLTVSGKKNIKKRQQKSS
jgi:hypothetical protein